MRRHLPAVALTLSLREVIQRELARGDAAAEDQRAIAVVRDRVITVDHCYAKGRQTFMAHAGNVEMAFALAIQILLAQIPVPALEQDREKTQLIFFADGGHVGSEDG
jgi:hypothetical protein